ncbi:hypothetical protein SARC_09519 [Sphaeroforma arctica JP610]|uniref:Uncharacterized protein n=1 Tax=Sphaeroforma arctica JP610 TaxID=667725 RepID=A0A0L0FMQ1_9EUKA|nr:hypothetical protein SARC_09519 [Sphaeroforma arctica JP610]KNC78035.1 hypothetical protein SARC_09519 [Sphaeroforma arctica JP610]|eukprot:XP_014151937.1 hypothetical protein SARC_09519 [Sphaeroforma arctica JP610]
MSDHHRDSSDKASYDRRSSMTYERNPLTPIPTPTRTPTPTLKLTHALFRRSDFDGSGDSESGGKIRGQAPSNRARDSFSRDNRGPQHGGGGGYYGNNQTGFHRGFAPVIPMGGPRGGKFVGPYGPMHAPVGGAYNRQISASHQRQFPPSHGFAPHHQRAHHPMAHYGHQQHSRNQNNKDADNGGPLQSRQSGDGLGNMRDGQRDTGFGGDRRDSNMNSESRDGFHGNNSEGKGSGGTNNPGSSPGKGAHSGSNNNGGAAGGSDKKDGGGGSGGTGSASGYGLDRRDSAPYASAKDSSGTSGTGKGTGGALDRRDTYGGMSGAMDRRELFSSNSTGNNGPMMDSNSSTSSMNMHGGVNQADHQAQDALTTQQQMQQQQHQHQNPGAGVYGGPMNSGQGAMGRQQSQHSRGMGMVRGGVGMGVGSINSYNAMGGDPSMQQLQYTNSQPNITGPGGAMPNSHLMGAHRGQQPLVYQTSGPMRGSVHDSPNRNGMAGMGRGPGGKRPSQGPGQGTTPAMIAQEQQRLRLEEEIQASGAADHLADWGTEELEKKSEECRMQYRQTFTKERELTGKLHKASENYYAARLVSDCCDM